MNESKRETCHEVIARMSKQYAAALCGECGPECNGIGCDRAAARKEFAIAFEIGARAMALVAGVPVAAERVDIDPKFLDDWCSRTWGHHFGGEAS